MPKKNLKLPQDESDEALSIFYSYPIYFIQALKKQYGTNQTKKLLEILNTFFTPHVRVLDKSVVDQKDILHKQKLCVAKLSDTQNVEQLGEDHAFYIQNATPVKLMEDLLQGQNFSPKKVLDLCASPGGKLLCAYALFPNAQFYANDISKEKIQRLQDNLQKYQMQANVSTGLAQKYSAEQNFDLILLDVPCSNSGVLHKRAEARHRLSDTFIKQLTQKQLLMIQNASKLLNDKGQIWYLTCSILEEENEKLCERACKEFGLTKLKQYNQLPDEEGRDGGFGCVLQKRKI